MPAFCNCYAQTLYLDLPEHKKRMLEVIAKPSAVIVSLHVTPGAKKKSLGGVHDGALRISVSEPADKGKANSAVIKRIARAVCVARTDVTITHGLTSRRKRILIECERPGSVAEKLNILATSGAKEDR